ncbi:GPI inositol-deacylase [Acrocarpospora catenulata]|uniref:GPI inositol-deacylase n=1 Tax=Acrocarpospora catenulata TaxID=2836182 RepID=UPI001BD963BF|nr:GPI inositol-deacylase [Acrocarpospora catenulata]
MTRILGIHGVGNFGYFRKHGSAAAKAVGAEWSVALGHEIEVVYYAHLLDRGIAQGDDPLVLDPGEQEILVSWIDLLVGVPQTPMGRTTAQLQQAVAWLTENYGRTAREIAIKFARDLNTYLYTPEHPFREITRTAVADAIRAHRPEILIAHSLGSVIAYEALCAHPDLQVELLVTIGSPLAMNQVVFQRLHPETTANRRDRPPGVRRWVNLADVGDIFAVPPDITTRFDNVEQAPKLTIAPVDFHRAVNYLAHPDVRDLVQPTP